MNWGGGVAHYQQALTVGGQRRSIRHVIATQIVFKPPSRPNKRVLLLHLFGNYIPLDILEKRAEDQHQRQ